MNSAGRWVADNPWKVIAVTLVITVAFGIFIPGINMVTDFREYLSSDNEAIKAVNEAEEKYGSASMLQVSIKPDEGTIFNKDVLERIKGLRENIAGLEGVKSVEGPLNSQIIVGKENSIVVGPAAPGGNVPASQSEMDAYREKLLESKLLEDRVVSGSGDAAALSVELKAGVNIKEVGTEVRNIVRTTRDRRR